MAVCGFAFVDYQFTHPGLGRGRNCCRIWCQRLDYWFDYRAIGTSLPELASSLIAVKKGEHDIALGNVIGSNLFNTLAVVGIAGLINPFAIPAEILTRDIAVMAGLTLAIFIFGFGLRSKQGRINRVEGGCLMLVFVAYTAYLISTIVA